MFLDQHIANYTISEQASVRDALKRIAEIKGRIIFIVNQNNTLKGLLTNGDIIRWLTQGDDVKLETPVLQIANTNYLYLSNEDPLSKSEQLLEKVLFLPLVDKQHRLIGVARKDYPEDAIKIGSHLINAASPAFVIAEIGNNHNGSLALAKKLIDASVDAGVDCAKFQMRNLKSLYLNEGNTSDASENLGSQYTLDLLSRFQLTNEELFEAFDYCKSKNILPLCTPWDMASLETLESYGMPAYKVASADFTNHELLKAIAATGKTMICSTGMCTEEEIIRSTQLLQAQGAAFVLLHCNSTYPAPFKDINLRYLKRLGEISSGPVGYSGHERGIDISIAAVALEAKVIERHITLDRTMEGNDHKASLLPGEFKQMVNGIRNLELSLGKGLDRAISQGELMNRVNLAKSLIAIVPIKKGDTIERSMLTIKSPGKGLQPMYLDELLGRAAKHDFQAGDFFYPSDIETEQVQARNYNFELPWGIPVRYHDFGSLRELSNFDLFEFHLSYKDMELVLEDFFEGSYSYEFVVHSPELFAGDHTLDLTTSDEAYRQHSIQELQRVIDVTRKLKQYFPKTKKPLIITNVGGFTSTGFMAKAERTACYQRLEQSLAALDSEGVEIIAQTMPPFPWHFGGQQYHNLFVEADEIVDFCERNQARICLDISHSKLACSHFDWSFHDFLTKTAPHTAHLHLADAESTGGEGLQIGDGEIDFPAVSEILKKYAPGTSFIPEIWQGHENNGEGFWVALERLETFSF